MNHVKQFLKKKKKQLAIGKLLLNKKLRLNNIRQPDYK